MKKLIIFLSLFVLMFGYQSFGYEQQSPIRISYIQGAAMVQRGFDMGFEDASVNLPLVDGDRIITQNGRIEIDLGEGNFIRLDNETKIEIDRKNDNVKVKLWSGSIYLDINNFIGEGTIVIGFPQGEVVPLKKGTYRIDFYNNLGKVIVRNGVAEVFTDEGSRYVRRSQNISLEDGRFTSRASYYYNDYDDEFDKWNYYRAQTINKLYSDDYGYEDSYLPRNLRKYSQNFRSNGRWIYVNDYGYCWRPISIINTWRPYYNGRWTWVYPYGWTWVSYDPWWPTYHYGRWVWDTYNGWIWAPGSTWGPAWVNWFHYGDYYGWAPVDYYGNPVIVVNNVWIRHYNRIPVNARSVVVLRKSSLMAKNVSRVALTGRALRSSAFSKITLRRISSQPLAVRNINKVRVGKKIILKRSYTPIVNANSTKRKGKVFKPSTTYRKISSIKSRSFRNKTGGITTTSKSKPYGTRIIKRDGSSSYTTTRKTYGKTHTGKSSYTTTRRRAVSKKKITKSSSSSTISNSTTRKKIKKKNGNNYPFNTYNNSPSNSGSSYRSSSSFYRYYRPKKIKKDYYGGTPRGYYTRRKSGSSYSNNSYGYNNSASSYKNKSYNKSSGFYRYYKPKTTVKRYSYGNSSGNYYKSKSYTNNNYKKYYNNSYSRNYNRYNKSYSYGNNSYNSSSSRSSSSFWQRFTRKSSPFKSSYNYKSYNYNKSYSSTPRNRYYKKYSYSGSSRNYTPKSSSSRSYSSHSSSSSRRSGFSSSSSSKSSSSRSIKKRK
jgi:hypothetical protein